jgi:Zn ribbon nucleic-acid-binding protein
LRDCVTCGHEERMRQSAATRQEMITRVNHKESAAVQEVEPQVLKLQ